ncbi:unnamed protein product [Fusarium graminearum]|nr:unnamed protein product [Fusarium graminearum]
MNPIIEIGSDALNNHSFARGDATREPGGAQHNEGIGVSSFLAALSSGFMIFMLQLVLFLLLRNKLRRISMRIKQQIRPKQVDLEPVGFFASIKQSWNRKDLDIAKKCGLDAYFFLRYLRTLLFLFAPLSALVIPVLIPLNYVNGRGHHLDADRFAKSGVNNSQVTGLDTLAWGNIRSSNSQRYWAHLVMSVATVAWVCALFFYEMKAYIKVRQTYLTSADQRMRPSTATILVDSVPTQICNDRDLRSLFNHFPGGVKNIWINKDLTLLLQMIDKRNKIVQQLEVAETILIKNTHYAEQGRRSKSRATPHIVSENIRIQERSNEDSRGFWTTDCEKYNSSGLWHMFLGKRDRPTHRLPIVGLHWLSCIVPFSKKVDTISWCRKELDELNGRIEEHQQLSDDLLPANSAFIQFNTQIAAHMACQSEIHHLPEHMTPKSIGFSPDEIIWPNLALSYKSTWVRTIMTYGVLIMTLSFWSVPVAWTGALSQVDQLVQTYDLFSFIDNAEVLRQITSVIAGLLPTMALATLLVLLPVLLQYLADFKGVKTYSSKEEFVQTFYFAFLFIQVFLVVSIASFFTASIKELVSNVQDMEEASEVVKILARNFPKSSNYFFSYMVLQSFSTSSATLLQMSSLVSHYILGPLFDVTARDKWIRKMGPRSVKWGSTFPVYTNFACIALIYCIISPLISVFAVLTFGLMWLSQRYTILNFYQTDHDTGGVLYPRALNQTFTGVYVMELCLTGLFFLVKDENGNAVCSAHAVIMVLVLVATVLFQTFLNWRFAPLFRFLPVDLGMQNVTMVSQKKQVKSVSQLQQRFLGDATNMNEATGMKISSLDQIIGSMNENFPTTLRDVPEEHNKLLIKEAFKHYALTVRRLTIWIPQDTIGVIDDEINQCRKVSSSISMSNLGAGLDDRGRVVCRGKPPDFSEFTYVKL